MTVSVMTVSVMTVFSEPAYQHSNRANMPRHPADPSGAKGDVAADLMAFVGAPLGSSAEEYIGWSAAPTIAQTPGGADTGTAASPPPEDTLIGESGRVVSAPVAPVDSCNSPSPPPGEALIGESGRVSGRITIGDLVSVAWKAGKTWDAASYTGTV